MPMSPGRGSHCLLPQTVEINSSHTSVIPKMEVGPVGGRQGGAHLLQEVHQPKRKGGAKRR